MKQEIYRQRVIKSNPYKLQKGGFSSNGSIEMQIDISKFRELRPPFLQGERFKTEAEADDFYLQEAKKLIDKNEA